MEEGVTAHLRSSLIAAASAAVEWILKVKLGSWESCCRWMVAFLHHTIALNKFLMILLLAVEYIPMLRAKSSRILSTEVPPTHSLRPQNVSPTPNNKKFIRVLLYPLTYNKETFWMSKYPAVCPLQTCMR